MRRNLDLAGGTLMAEALGVALAPHLGRVDAQDAVKAASARALREGITLQRAAAEDTRIASILSAERIERALDPSRFLGNTDALIDLALASFREQP